MEQARAASSDSRSRSLIASVNRPEAARYLCSARPAIVIADRRGRWQRCDL